MLQRYWLRAEGAFPYHAIVFLQRHMQRVEGLLRCFVGDVDQTTRGVVGSVNGVLERRAGDDEEALLHFFEQRASSHASSRAQGRGARRRGRGGGARARGRASGGRGGADGSLADAGSAADGLEADNLEEDLPEEEPGAPWYGFAARRCALLAARLEDLLLTGAQMTSLYAAWASVPFPVLRGVVYLDRGFVYLDGEGYGNTMRPATEAERRSLYLCVPHKLLPPPQPAPPSTLDVMQALGAPTLNTEGANDREAAAEEIAPELYLGDPVLRAAAERVDAYYAQSFWGNAAGIECQMAGIALAKRGVNVTRCFFPVGAGGRWHLALDGAH
jgi:hypothetical protein